MTWFLISLSVLANSRLHESIARLSSNFVPHRLLAEHCWQISSRDRGTWGNLWFVCNAGCLGEMATVLAQFLSQMCSAVILLSTAVDGKLHVDVYHRAVSGSCSSDWRPSARRANDRLGRMGNSSAGRFRRLYQKGDANYMSALHFTSTIVQNQVYKWTTSGMYRSPNCLL